VNVALVCMPFADVERPALGVSLLKSELLSDGAACSVIYPNVAFARRIGLPDYRFITETVSWHTLLAEWIFARSLYGSSRMEDDGYINEVLLGQGKMSLAVVDRVLGVRDEAEAFVEKLAKSVPWQDFDVVGFTSYCGQNLASLALARRIKAAHPHVVIVFGGRNWEGEMGLELHHRFPFVDFACSGEADVAFPALIRAVGARGSRDVPDIRGLVYRDGSRSRCTGPTPIVDDLDGLPLPDFAEYFAALAETGYSHQFIPALTMELSRGCWWAAKHPCSFCGLNGTRTTYRAKSPARFLSEARALTSTFPASHLELVDMVAPPSFFTKSLPELAENPLAVPLFVQVRATMSYEDIARAERAGVELQCGIESLSDSVLSRANKGTSSLENLRFLKWCQACGLEPTWPMLAGFPQEGEEDYVSTWELMESVSFLPPPSQLGSVLVPRFSPYFCEPELYGLGNLRPLAAYQHLYPFSEATLSRIALFFTDDDTMSTARPYLQRLEEVVREWRRSYGSKGDLQAVETEAGLALRDSREVAMERELILDALDEAIYRACDSIATRDQLATLAADRFPEVASSLEERLERLLTLRVMARSKDRYISLAVSAQS
jgi:ribosomal peptide maturation radical SAM protein 1